MNRWTRRILVCLAAFAVAGAAGAQVVRFRGSSAGNFTARLSGAQEVPAVDTAGHGQALLSVNDDRSEVSYKVLVANVENMTQSHIHCGAAGVNGPVVVFLFGLIPEGETLNGILAQGRFTAANIIPRPDSAACPGGVADLEGLLAKMEAGMTYVNVHTLQFPGGEIRGQVQPPDEE